MNALAVHDTVMMAPPRPPRTPKEFRFDALTLVSSAPAVARGKTLTASFVVHGLIVAAVLILPLFWEISLPQVPDDALKAFFVMPEQAPPPPPPPPAPRASAARQTKPTPPVQSQSTPKFLAPIEVPPDVRPEPSIDLGIDGGVAGGVEGGVAGGVVGGIVGGLPTVVAAAPAQVVRIGGAIKAPKRVHAVAPEYPRLAVAARVTGVVVVEAHVDTRGQVRDAHVLSGNPLLDPAAVAAVLEWRYQPLLLNGIPTEFLLTVTVQFSLTSGATAAP